MKKVLSTLVAVLVAVCFSGMVFAAEPAHTETTTITKKTTVVKKKKAAYKKSKAARKARNKSAFRKFVEHEGKVDNQRRIDRNKEYQKSEQRRMDIRREEQKRQTH